VQQFFRWYAAEEEVPKPDGRDEPAACSRAACACAAQGATHRVAEVPLGKTFVDRRDLASLYVFMDAGVRRAEMANILVTDIDLDMRRGGSTARSA
jgi:integrase/recombinase XerC